MDIFIEKITSISIIVMGLHPQILDFFFLPKILVGLKIYKYFSGDQIAGQA